MSDPAYGDIGDPAHDDIGDPAHDDIGDPAHDDIGEAEVDAYAEPTPEQYAERARKADKATRGALAAILALEALVVLLVPRAIAVTSGLSTTRTLILIGLAVVLVLAAGLLRRPWGIAFGSALQFFFTATGFLTATMFFVGVVFLAIWVRLLMLRHEVVGSPGGLRMLAG